MAIFKGKNEVTSYLGIEEAYRLLSQPAAEHEEEEFEFSVVVPGCGFAEEEAGRLGSG